MRTDRKNDELRQITFTRDFTKNALGSVLVQFGNTKVITTRLGYSRIFSFTFFHWDKM